MDAVRLSPDHAAFVDSEVATGDYADASDYVARLIDAQARAQSQARLEEMLLEGLQDEADLWTEQDSVRLRRLAAQGR